MSDLIEMIETSFADVQFPGDDDLTDSTYGEEPALLIEEFSDKVDWRVLTTDLLNKSPGGYGSALSFFSYRSLRFYLPAYLIADIEDRLESISDPAFRLCVNVTPGGGKQKLAKVWGGGTMGDRDKAGFDLFSPKQVSAIAAYLWWKLESVGGYDEVIEQALINYWLPRAEEGC